MAQHDYVIANGTGAAVRSDLNNALAAIVSQNSGATEPATTYAFQFWADTTTGTLKLRNSANSAWIELLQLDGTLTMEDGTEALPGLSFRSDLDTGLWRPGTNQLAISTNAVERVEFGASEVVFNDGGANYDFRVEGDTNANLLFVDASADAVGIGTSSPQAELNVAKTGSAATVYIESDAGNNATTSILRFGGASGRSASIQGFRGASSNVHSLDFYTYNSADTFGMRLTPTGLGIGTTSPVEKLDVVTSSGDSYVRTTNGTVTLYSGISSSFTSGFIGTSTSHPLVLGAANAEKARIDTSGRLLVGTSTAPVDGKLYVQGNSFSATEGGVLHLMRGEAATAITVGEEIGKIAFSDNAGKDFATITTLADAAAGTNDYPGRLVFSTTADGASSPTERLRIANNGAWGLGGANYGSSGQVLTSNGSGSAPTWSAAGGGKILQVVQAAKTNVFSTTSSSFVDVTGLSASITPSSSTSKILIMLNGSAGMDTGASGAIRLVRDSTAIFVGDTTAGYTSVSGPNFYGGSNDGNNNEAFAISYLDSPGTTSAVTYKAQIAAVQGSGTLRVNALGSDNSGQAYSLRTASSIILLEVAA